MTRLNWKVPVDCPGGCGKQITVDLSKTSARCPRCGPIRLTGDAAAKTREVERELAAFQRKMKKMFK